MGSLWRDVRFSLKMFAGNPGFTAVAVLSLAIGIGANTTIFSVLNTVLLRPFPVHEPDRLVVLHQFHRKEGFPRNPTGKMCEEWRTRTRSFESMALFDGAGSGPANLTGAGEAVRIRQASVGPELFDVLGVKPVLGRGFLPEDIPATESTTVVISYGFWQEHFKGDPTVIGRRVVIEGSPKTIVGVMPAGFWTHPSAKDTDAWLAYDLRNLPTTRWLFPLARLKPGVTIEQAQAELNTLAFAAEQDDPKTNKDWGARVQGLHEYAVGNYPAFLYLLLGAVGFVLLIACANVANLLLVRAAARKKEVAVRASLGASRLRLLRQFLTESVVLAAFGGALGILFAAWGNRLFIALTPAWFARVSEVQLDSTVLGFTVALSVLTGILFGLAPALKGTRVNLNESLKESGGRSTVGARQRGRSALVIAELSLAFVLLIGAGLMINSFLRLQNVDLGFQPDNVLTAEVLLAGPRYYQVLSGDMKRVTPQGVVFFDELLSRLKRIPRVESTGIATMAPPGWSPSTAFRIAGDSDSLKRPQGAMCSEVSPEFFRTIKIPLVRGRYLNDRDTMNAPWVVVINETMARRYFAKENPLGKQLYLTIMGEASGRNVDEGRPREIVGVVGDVRQYGPQAEPMPMMYASYLQHVWEYPGGFYTSHLRKNIVIRASSDPAALTAAVQKAVGEVDKDQVVYNFRTMKQAVSESIGPGRLLLGLFGTFGALALLLASVGIYGVMSYSVAQRTHEIGVRMAVGATRNNVVRLVLKQGLVITLAGLAIGIGGSIALTRLLRGLLYGIEPTDPLTFTAVSLVLAIIALAACLIPARRAAKVDPMVALRYE